MPLVPPLLLFIHQIDLTLFTFVVSGSRLLLYTFTLFVSFALRCHCSTSLLSKAEHLPACTALSLADSLHSFQPHRVLVWNLLGTACALAPCSERHLLTPVYRLQLFPLPSDQGLPTSSLPPCWHPFSSRRSFIRAGRPEQQCNKSHTIHLVEPSQTQSSWPLVVDPRVDQRLSRAHQHQPLSSPTKTSPSRTVPRLSSSSSIIQTTARLQSSSPNIPSTLIPSHPHHGLLRR